MKDDDNNDNDDYDDGSKDGDDYFYYYCFWQMKSQDRIIFGLVWQGAVPV